MPRRKTATVNEEIATDGDMESLIKELCEWIEDGTLDLYLESIDVALENRNERYRKELRSERSQSHAAIAKSVPGTESRVPSVKRSATRTEPLARTRKTTAPKQETPVVESTGNDLVPGDLYYIKGDRYWAVAAKFLHVNQKTGKAVMEVSEKTPIELQDEFAPGRKFNIPVSSLEPRPTRGRPRTPRVEE